MVIAVIVLPPAVNILSSRQARSQTDFSEEANRIFGSVLDKKQYYGCINLISKYQI